MTAIMQSRARTLENRFYGVVIAIVEDNNDPDKRGRVKVSYPWFDEGTISDWCRVRQFCAGPGYGAFFVPEKGDEVLVAFVHGDMDEPIVLGGLYNGQDAPPSYRDGSTKDEKVIRTKGGHQVTLDDSASSKKVAVETSGGHALVLDDQNQRASIKTTGGHELVLDDQQQSVTLRSSSGMSVVIDSGGTIKCTGTSVVLAAPQVKLGGDAAMSSLVLGEAFMTLFNAHTHQLGLAPTTPPVEPMLPILLSQVTKTV
jgi:phage baseplate assembly protein V